MVTSESIDKLAAALAGAQAEMGGAVKDSANPFFKSKYADFASVRDACFPALTKHGIAVVQAPSVDGMTVRVETRLIHESGQWIGDTVSCAAKDDCPQAIGSAISYLKRYALQSMAGVAAEDDDGEAAQGRPQARHEQPRAAVVQLPVGYADWLTDLEAVAQDGTPALERVWKASKPEYRQHLTKTNPKAWEALKQKAAMLTSEIPA